MRKIVILFVVLHYALSSYAQTLPGKCEAFLPKILLDSKVVYEANANALLSSPTYGQDGKPSEKKYWVVYSDRSNNKTYTTPGGSEVCTTLGFNEKLRIAKIDGQWALVYDDPVTTTTYPKISGEAVCKGWIKMDNLLLWNSCLANERGIYYKALLCINADEKNVTNYGIGFINPSDPSSQMKLSTDMKFYFVMKRAKDGKVLLATQHKMSDALSSQILYAWVPAESFVPWNQRSVIEPTWEHEDVEYFASKNIISRIYDSPSLSGTESAVVLFKKSNKPYDQYQYRMVPSALRFPILDGTDDAKYECSSFTSSIGSVNLIQEDDPLWAKIKDELYKLIQINLVIVIDGTKSMEPYFPAVERAIKEGCAFFDNEKFDIKIGVLIYRDYSDGEAGLIELVPPTRPNDPNLFSFLETGGKYGFKSASSEHSYTEALYHGMNTALDRFRFSQDQSNLLLVVGECGNAENDPRAPQQSEIIQKLVQKNVNLVGFQVRNIDSDAWNLFNNQLLTIIKQSLQRKYDNLFEGLKVKAKVATDGQVFTTDGISNPLYLGAHKYAAQGDEISPDVLADLMKNTIKDYSTIVQHEIDLVTGVFGKTEPSDAITIESNNEWLRQILGINYVNGSDQLVGFRGWTAKKDASGREFYKDVLFISSEEFDELMTRLKPVDDVAKVADSDNRKPYIDAIKALLKSMAPGITNSEMDQKGIGEVMDMIEGLNAKSESMYTRNEGNWTLLQVADNAAVKPAEYRRIVSEFSRKYQNLSRIKDGNYKYVREFNGAKYYWIPIEFLP